MEEFILPDGCLYKYRGDIYRDILTIKNSQIYIPNWKDLNDPNESSINFNNMLCEVDNIKKFGSYLHKNDITNQANACIDFINGLENKIGIYSLSKRNDIESLWAYYSNGHKGFCIEYDAEKLIEYLSKDNNFYSFTNVVYKNDRYSPSIDEFINITSNQEGVKRIYLDYYSVKSKAWEKEEEVRFVFNTSRIYKRIDKSFIKAIYIGTRCSDEDKMLIINSLKDIVKEFYQMKFQNDSFEMYSELIET